MKIVARESFTEFTEETDHMYKKAVFLDEEKIFFLNRAAVMEQDVRRLVLIRAPKIYQDVVTCVTNLDKSRLMVVVGFDERSHRAPEAACARHQERSHVFKKPLTTRAVL